MLPVFKIRLAVLSFTKWLNILVQPLYIVENGGSTTTAHCLAPVQRSDHSVIMEPADSPHDVQCVLPVCEYVGSLQTLTQFGWCYLLVFVQERLCCGVLLFWTKYISGSERSSSAVSSAYESITVWGRDCDSEPQTCDSEPQTVVCVTTVTVRERESELVWQWATDSNMYDSSHSERERERELVWQWATDSNMYDSSHSVRERES